MQEHLWTFVGVMQEHLWTFVSAFGNRQSHMSYSFCYKCLKCQCIRTLDDTIYSDTGAHITIKYAISSNEALLNNYITEEPSCGEVRLSNLLL